MTHTIDAIEKNTFEQKAVDIGERMRSLHSSFQKSLSPEGKTFSGPENLSFDRSITDSFGLRGVEITPEVRAGAVRTVKDMYYGKEVNGSNSLGLKKISSWKISPENRKANLNQHAGFAAEVISTAKENYISEAKHTGDMTYRADDIPAGLRDKLSEKGVNIARKNDQFIDKVRVRADGTIETVQTKFVGKDADSCLSRLMSKRFEKYLDNPAVDKIEVPKEYYDDLKTSISVKKKELCKQYGVVSTAAEKTLDAAKIKHNITKLDTLRDKIEPSVVTSLGARFAAKHPKIFGALHTLGKSDIVMAGFDIAFSSIDAFVDWDKGKISKDELCDKVKENSGRVAAGLVGGYAGAIIGGVVGLKFGGVKGMEIGSELGAAAGSIAAEEAYKYIVEHYDEIKEMVVEFGDDFKELKDAAVEKTVEVGEDIKEFAVDTADYIADGAVKVGKGIQKGAKKAKAAVVKKVKGIFD